jgi:hypothetical protein
MGHWKTISQICLKIGIHSLDSTLRFATSFLEIFGIEFNGKLRKKPEKVRKKVTHQKILVLNQHNSIVCQFDTQTYVNDSFSCEIHTHACRLLNIFIGKTNSFYRAHARVLLRHSRVCFYLKSVISTSIV